MAGEVAVAAESGGGSAAFLGPPSSSANTKLKLPADTGAAGKVLAVKSANHSATNAELEWATVGGVFSSYALIIDSKSSNTNGGVAATSTWNVRDLNTEVADPDSIVSISSNKFTLGAGNYVIKWSCPAHQINRNQSRLYDVTNSAVIGYGQAMRSYASDVTTSLSTGVARVTPSGSTEYRLEHNCETTSNGNNEFGQGNSLGGTMTYTIVEIYKEA